MAYPKPLSEKNILKMYERAGIDETEKDFLQKYFTACANLYGFIDTEQAYELYEELCEKNAYPAIDRKKFMTFSAIARREEHGYRVYELDELFDEERDEEWKLIVHNDLVGVGYYRHYVLYHVQLAQQEYSYYVPDDILDFVDYTCSQEEDLEDFLAGLRSSRSVIEDKWGHKRKNEHAGEKLSEFDFLNHMEEVSLKYERGELEGKKTVNKPMVEYEERKTKGPESAKLTRNIRNWTLVGNVDAMQVMKFTFEELDEVGVNLTEAQTQKLLKLLQEYHNHVHHWHMSGWAPSELARKTYRPGTKPQIQFGENIERMIANGEYDRNELVEMIESQGLLVSDQSKYGRS